MTLGVVEQPGCKTSTLKKRIDTGIIFISVPKLSISEFSSREPKSIDQIFFPNRSRIHVVIFSSTSTEKLSSISPYSEGNPVLQC